MNKVFLLGANKQIDRAEQVVEVNQIIQMEGYSCDKYVVYEVSKNDWGITYKLINLRTKEFNTANIIRPLKEKFGIGFYYDSENPQFMDSFEVAMLLQEARQKKQAEDEEAQQKRIRTEKIEQVGRERLIQIFPEDAQAVIVARQMQDESDPYTDYHASRIIRTVILGFSKHKRDLFSEMRKYASHFEGTAYLSEKNEKYEHREKYSMGAGYYLGRSKYSGWIIEKIPVYNREQTIKDLSYTAGEEENIRLGNTIATHPDKQSEQTDGNYMLVEYSEKAVAVFGETRAIKEELKAMGGRFNSRLTHNGKKSAGWIFPKLQEERLALYFGLN